jgi:hypothetical protein
MKITKTMSIFIVTIFLSGFTVRGQSVERSVIGAGGGNYFDGINFEMDYSIGEFATITLSNANNFLTQGFQQPFVDTTTTIMDAGNPGMIISYFPNPTSGNLSINISNPSNQKITIDLFDVLGQIIISNNSEIAIAGNTNLVLDMKNCATGNYFLRIKSNENYVKSFKILKN